ncbi:MAG: glucose-6-phosphate isomerase, partial [Synergistaceae bacterium]|nr:glucose-6-phosphate isomerase [Synergistaceae bacterium]
MDHVSFDYENALKFVAEHEVESMKFTAMNAAEKLKSRKGEGNDFQGWIDLPINYDKDEFARIKKAAAKIQADSDVLLVIGIGGSYLGARAAIEFLRHGFYNEMTKESRKTPQIYYVGNSMSGTYIEDVIDLLGDKDFSINVISKSGTTTESAIAFRVFLELLEKKYGKAEAAKRVYSTTDKARGALKTLSDSAGYECFVIPDDIGG